MKSKLITALHDVRCDICGCGIRKGEPCWMVTDVRHSYVFFEHVNCPTPIHVRNRKLPAPSLSNGMAFA